MLAVSLGLSGRCDDGVRAFQSKTSNARDGRGDRQHAARINNKSRRARGAEISIIAEASYRDAILRGEGDRAAGQIDRAESAGRASCDQG